MTTVNKPPISFWVISTIALLWNLMGVNQYILMAYKSEVLRASLSEEKLAIIDATPAWATAAFAIAVFSASLGCIALLLRKKTANLLFIISFFAILIQNIDGFIRYDFSKFTLMEVAMSTMIPLFGFFLIWYSKNAIVKGWLK